MTTPMLAVHDLHAWYGKSHVLQGVTFDIAAGEIVALLGRNGSGRSTTAKALMGLVHASGDVRFKGHALIGCATHDIARLGLGYVPESRDVFPDLTVQQNLQLGIKNPRRPGRWALADMYALFPRLQERAQAPAGVLSGGEQQMLTLCRTLMGDPDLVLVDEPTEGLAPQVITQVAHFLRTLRARGVSVLLIEQKRTLALQVADRVLVMGHGAIVFSGTPVELAAAPEVSARWLAV